MGQRIEEELRRDSIGQMTLQQANKCLNDNECSDKNNKQASINCIPLFSECFCLVYSLFCYLSFTDLCDEEACLHMYRYALNHPGGKKGKEEDVRK